MFEDSTFESTGRIRTRSRGWMIAAFFFNGSILLALILIPLIYPEALPRQMMNILLEAPPPPPPPPRPVPQAAPQTSRNHSEIENGHIFAPPRIPTTIALLTKLEPAPSATIPGLDPSQAESGIPGSLFPGQTIRPVVRGEPKGPVHLSSGVVSGLLLKKTPPVYPPIAVASRTEGVVVLQATISTSGTIENLHVISGPAMLHQAALDAVSNWRYRPFLLNGAPVEVETTVNVIFTMNR
ncbi:MAG TPA: TonB family protein [Terracidiphilus sp.]